jgi:hypothetical protein
MRGSTHSRSKCRCDAWSQESVTCLQLASYTYARMYPLRATYMYSLKKHCYNAFLLVNSTRSRPSRPDPRAAAPGRTGEPSPERLSPLPTISLSSRRRRDRRRAKPWRRGGGGASSWQRSGAEIRHPRQRRRSPRPDPRQSSGMVAAGGSRRPDPATVDGCRSGHGPILDPDGPRRAVTILLLLRCHRMAYGGSRASPAARGCLGRRFQAWWWWPPSPPKVVDPWR